jgi:hypothetical protein
MDTSRNSLKHPFYLEQDFPTKEEKIELWESISMGVHPNQFHKKRPIDWRSFWMGSVAALIVFFSFIGLFTTVKSLRAPTNLSGYQIDEAYEEALTNLQMLSPKLVAHETGVNSQNVISVQQENLEEIDTMIEEIRTDMLINGVSDIKRRQLKRLYAMKLQIVKELLLNDSWSS